MHIRKIMIDAMPETNEKEIEEKKKAKESLKQHRKKNGMRVERHCGTSNCLDAQIKIGLSGRAG